GGPPQHRRRRAHARRADGALRAAHAGRGGAGVTRIGAVEFLNARPLAWGLERAGWCDVRFDVPSECARLLHAGRIDVGLVPAIELLRGDTPYEVVPGLAIACRGRVDSVMLFSRRPVSDIRTIALDTSSRASA